RICSRSWGSTPRSWRSTPRAAWRCPSEDSPACPRPEGEMQTVWDGPYPTSWWLARAAAEVPPPADPLPAAAEGVGVGGGVMGVSVAYWLARAGTGVVVLEADRLACGATGRNAGLMLAGGPPLEDPALVSEVLREEGIEADFATPGHLALITRAELWDKVL